MRSKGVGICATCKHAKSIVNNTVDCNSMDIMTWNDNHDTFRDGMKTVEFLYDESTCDYWRCKNSGVTLGEARERAL